MRSIALTAAAGALALGCATESNAEDLRISLAEESVTRISEGVASAATPEEAARVFAKLASEAIGQAVADTLAQTVNMVAEKSNNDDSTANQGWEEFINGCGIDFSWPSPGLTTVSNLPTIVSTSKREVAETEASDVEARIQVSISGTF